VFVWSYKPLETPTSCSLQMFINHVKHNDLHHLGGGEIWEDQLLYTLWILGEKEKDKEGREDRAEEKHILNCY